MYKEDLTQLKSVNKNKGYLHIVIFIYWAILVVWQNISEYSAQGTADTVLKVGLLIFLTISYLIFTGSNQRINPLNLALFTVFLISQIITFFFEPSVSFRTVVSYVFPLLFLFLSFVYNGGYKINKAQYITFLNCIIAVVAYSAMYAVIFKTEYFRQAFSITTAYSNELSSFFVSNHEYGMYLLAGIISCIACLEFKKSQPIKKKIIYFLCIILFIPNIVLTFSRTSILAMVGFLTVYIFFMGQSKTKRWAVVAILALVIVYAASETLRDFVLKIVLKENSTAGRDVLYRLAIDFYKESDLLHQIFGSGIQVARSFFDAETSHGSVHNAYLQVLIYYGAIGLIFMLGIIISRLNASVKLVKKDKFTGIVSLALTASCILLMFSNTTILFNSPIDSFFLTAFFIVVPKYLENDIMNQGDSV